MNSNALVVTLQAEDPARGTLEVIHTTDMSDLNTYMGPLGRIIIHNPGMPDSQFVCPVDEFIILLAQFIQNFRGIQ